MEMLIESSEVYLTSDSRMVFLLLQRLDGQGIRDHAVRTMSGMNQHDMICNGPVRRTGFLGTGRKEGKYQKQTNQHQTLKDIC